jgi:hypothetical protein
MAAVGVHVGDVGFEFDVWVEVADVSKGLFQPLWLVGLVRSSTHRPHQLRNQSKKTLSRRLKQAASLVGAMLRSSATKIFDLAFYYFAFSMLHVYLLVREKMLRWLAFARKKDETGDCLFWQIIPR